MLSPQPPHTQSFLRSFGLPVLEQLHVFKRPSRQARAIAYATPAALIDCTNAASRLPEIETNRNLTPRRFTGPNVRRIIQIVTTRPNNYGEKHLIFFYYSF